MTAAVDKFQMLLRELFQFDSADLDFGIYRINYQDGDFLSKRRYSRRERYAIPYNGEEVYLYWANHDQYYVKTAEVVIPFEYRPLNAQEDIAYGKRNQQEAIIAQALVEIPKRFSLKTAGRCSSTAIRSSGTPRRWSRCSRPGCLLRWRAEDELED